MLGASIVGYVNGVSGPFWFAAGCSPMIVFFALLGISCKRKIPEAHTLLEIVRIRYGRCISTLYEARIHDTNGQLQARQLMSCTCSSAWSTT